MLASCYTFWFTISNELYWLPEYATDQAKRSNLFETFRTFDSPHFGIPRSGGVIEIRQKPLIDNFLLDGRVPSLSADPLDYESSEGLELCFVLFHVAISCSVQAFGIHSLERKLSCGFPDVCPPNPAPPQIFHISSNSVSILLSSLGLKPVDLSLVQIFPSHLTCNPL